MSETSFWITLRDSSPEIAVQPFIRFKSLQTSGCRQPKLPAHQKMEHRVAQLFPAGDESLGEASISCLHFSAAASQRRLPAAPMLRPPVEVQAKVSEGITSLLILELWHVNNVACMIATATSLLMETRYQLYVVQATHAVPDQFATPTHVGPLR